MPRPLGLSLVLSIFAAAPAAHAGLWDSISQFKRPNMRWGQTSIHPYYQVSEMYDSNIYLMPPDLNGVQRGGGVKSAWITRNILGLRTNSQIGRLQTLDLGYEFESQLYSKDAERNDNIRQRVDADYNYKGARGLSGRLRDTYLNTTDPGFVELVNRERRWQNTFGAALDYDLPGSRMTAGVSYVHVVHKYLNPTLASILNRNEQAFGARMGYKVQPKTQVYTSYARTITHYSVHRESPTDQDKNNKGHRVGFGIEGQITPKIDGQVETGMTYREYDEAPVGGGGQTVTRNWNVKTSLTYLPIERLRAILTGRRDLQESTFGNNRFTIENGASLDVQYKLPRKITVGSMLGMYIVKFPEGASSSTRRRDDIYQQGAMVKYDIQEWLWTSLTYLHRQRFSSLSGEFNYNDHQTALNLSVEF